MLSPDEGQKTECVDKMTSNLSTLRAMLHLSQADLAELIGVARSTVAFIEGGQRRMTWTTFLSLMFVFTQRKETRDLLTFLGIYPDGLKAVYRGEHKN